MNEENAVMVDRRSEVEELLAKDDGRVGEVWRYLRDGLSMEQIREIRGTATPPTNEITMIKVIRDGFVPNGPTVADLGAALVRRWLKSKPLSSALTTDLEAQLRDLVAAGSKA
jgi:hypothetical protein